MEYIVDINEKKASITSFVDNSEIIEIPSILDGAEVTEIDAFSLDCPNAKKIILPETLENILYNNFYECTNLEVVDMSKTKITHLNENIFDTCTLKEVILPPNLEVINDSFKNCTIEKLVIPDSVKHIENGFANCKIKEIYLGEGLEEDANFGSNFSFGKINVNAKSKNYTSDNGFLYFKDTLISAPKEYIKEYKIPDNIHKIKTGSFNKTKIGKLDLNNVEFVGKFAFQKAEIDTILANNLTKISSYGFYELHTKNIEVKSLTFIDTSVFSCSSIENIVLNEKLTTICENAFYEANITKFKCPKELLTIESGAFAESKLETIEFNDKLTTINDGAFSNCLKTAQIIIPKTVKYIGPEAFTYSENAFYLFSKDVNYCNSIAFYTKQNVCKNIVVPIKDGNFKAFFYDTNLADKEITTDISIDSLLKEGVNFKDVNKIMKYEER